MVEKISSRRILGISTLGRWDLLKDRPCEPDEIQTSETICTGVKTKWEVLTLARLHHKERTLPYMYSREYWKDVERGRPTWWARVCYIIGNYGGLRSGLN